MPLISLPVGRGTATGVDPSLTEQLQESIGVVYKVGDPAAHKFPGRTALNDTPLAANECRDVQFSDGRLMALCDNTAFSLSPSTGAATSIFTMDGSPSELDVTSLNDITYVVSGRQSDNVAPFGAFAIGSASNATGYRMGLDPVVEVPLVTAIAGTLAGTFRYWTTEYDDDHAVESSYDDTLDVVSITPATQGVRVTKPATRNASATHWRIYRTIASGSRPIGWLVAQVAIATTTYDDDMSDAELVLNAPYRIVSPNGVPESMDGQASQGLQQLAISSITTFEGSLVGVHLGGVGYTPAGEPHSWPGSYTLQMPTKYSGREKCVRACGDGCYVSTSHELFRINYLPDETDSVFSAGVAIEHVANYGTPSARGMCSFTAWGGAPVLFVASLQGPILCAGKVVDRAVLNIDWAALVNLSLLGSCKVVDNPARYRVEVYYLTDNSPRTWECLHFYYDSERTTRTDGPLPEMAWTGPHPVPGPGCYAVSSNTPKSYTAGDLNDSGLVYEEDSGTVDAALLTDADGTIPFTLRTRRTYQNPMDTQSRADRVYIHCREQNDDQDYNVTFTAYRENGQSTSHPNKIIEASGNGMVSHTLNATHVSFDVTVNADGVSGMAPINNISVRTEEPVKALKTQVV